MTHKIIEKKNALYNAEKLKLRVFDWIESGLMVVNMQGRITTINQRALEWIPGESRNSVLGMPFTDFYPADLAFAAQGGGHRRSEERRVGKECRSRWSPYH